MHKLSSPIYALVCTRTLEGIAHNAASLKIVHIMTKTPLC
jgi:hypothetical protein